MCTAHVPRRQCSRSKHAPSTHGSRGRRTVSAAWLGPGRIVVSEIEAPNLLVNLV
jgi:hypothetical protein